MHSKMTTQEKNHQKIIINLFTRRVIFVCVVLLSPPVRVFHILTKYFAISFFFLKRILLNNSATFYHRQGPRQLFSGKKNLKDKKKIIPDTPLFLVQSASFEFLEFYFCFFDNGLLFSPPIFSKFTPQTCTSSSSPSSFRNSGIIFQLFFSSSPFIETKTRLFMMISQFATYF